MNERMTSQKEKRKKKGSYRFTYPHKRMDHQFGNVLGPSVGILLEVELCNRGLSSFCHKSMAPANGWAIVSSLDDGDLLIKNLNDWRRLRDKRGCLGRGCPLQRGPLH